MTTTANTIKKPYEKPSMKVFQLTTPTNRLLVDSDDPEWRGIPGGPYQF